MIKLCIILLCGVAVFMSFTAILWSVMKLSEKLTTAIMHPKIKWVLMNLLIVAMFTVISISSAFIVKPVITILFEF